MLLMLLFTIASKIKVYICKFQPNEKNCLSFIFLFQYFLDFSVSLIKFLTTELNEFLRLLKAFAQTVDIQFIAIDAGYYLFKACLLYTSDAADDQ